MFLRKSGKSLLVFCEGLLKFYEGTLHIRIEAVLRFCDVNDYSITTKFLINRVSWVIPHHAQPSQVEVIQSKPCNKNKATSTEDNAKADSWPETRPTTTWASSTQSVPKDSGQPSEVKPQVLILKVSEGTRTQIRMPMVEGTQLRFVTLLLWLIQEGSVLGSTLQETSRTSSDIIDWINEGFEL